MKSLLLVLLIFSSTLLWAKESIRLGIDEFPPHISKDLPYYGFLPRIISESFAFSDISVEYVFVPWRRAIIRAEKGDLDGTPAWFKTPEREEVFYISAPLIDDSQSFFYLKDAPFDWQTIDDLKGITIGATLGYDYGEDFAIAENSESIKVERVSTDLQNFQKLITKRIVVFPMNTFAGYAILQKEFPVEIAEQVTHHRLPLRAKPLYLLLSKNVENNERLIMLFDEGLDKLHKSGKYSQYMDEMLKVKE